MSMDIDGYQAVIAFDPDIRGHLTQFHGDADFYAADEEGLKRKGKISLEVFVDKCEENGVLHTFSGRFNARLSPELHAAAAAKTEFVKHKAGKRKRNSVCIPPMQTLLDSFFRLLKLYEGVVVIDDNSQRNMNDKGLFVHLRISNPRSIVRLLYCATGANIRSDVYEENAFPKDSDSTEETLGGLVWTLIFDKPSMQEDLDIYCIFMVWDLGERGVLSESDYEKLLSLLGGVKRTWGVRKSTAKEAK